MKESTTLEERPRTGSKFGSQGSAPSQEEILRKMEAAGTPGPAHKALDALVGNWKAEVKCWHDPSGQPQTSHGSATAKWILNGRFLQEDFRGEMMGRPFTGLSLMGYDNTKQKYFTLWVSEMQTAMFVSEGTADTGTKTITLVGKADCPATGRRDIPMKTVFRLLSPDKHVFEMYDDNTKTMEITYTRQ
jgi:hypothetical protein